MPLRIAIWKIEAKLLGLILIETLLLTLVSALVLAEAAVFPAYMWGASLATYYKVAEVLAALAASLAALWMIWPATAIQHDEPLREPLGAWPVMDAAVREVARELKRPAPRSVSFILSPVVWRRLGCDPVRLRNRGEIAVPAGCLAIWPIMSLRCQVGHALVRRRPNAWLFHVVHNSVSRLEQAGRSSSIRPVRIKNTRLLKSYRELLFKWSILADIEADARIAHLLGGSAVSTWICQTQLGAQIVPECLRRIVQPAAERGVLLPIADACAAFYRLIEPGWTAVVEAEMVKAQQSKPGNPFLRPLVMRLAVVPQRPGSMHDPRPAVSLLPDLSSLEERLMRNEAALGNRPLRRAAIDELGEVLLAAMREDVGRNAAALEGRSLADLPDLVREAPALAERYRADPRYLFDPGQRKKLVPGLLASFLAVELAGKGWRAAYAVPPGLTMEKDGKSLCPLRVVAALGKGAMSREGFLALVEEERGGEV